MSRPLRAPRGDNRQSRLLDEAARLFGSRGFEGASIRDIVRAVDMLPGSLYYHFARKEDLLVAVYAEGVRRITARVETAATAHTEPWDRLEAACVAHLGALLEEGDYAQVVIRVRPDDVPAVAPQLIAMRDTYEALFAGLIAELPLRPGRDPKSLRLLLLGALNWSQTWYRPGKDDPHAIARRFVGLLREPGTEG